MFGRTALNGGIISVQISSAIEVFFFPSVTEIRGEANAWHQNEGFGTEQSCRGYMEVIERWMDGRGDGYSRSHQLAASARSERGRHHVRMIGWKQHSYR
jgi:hypothetical protein